MDSKLLTFYGLADTLTRWHEIIAQVQDTSQHIDEDISLVDERWQFQAELTDRQREELMVYWHADAGTGERLPNGEPLRWNDCISYGVD